MSFRGYSMHFRVGFACACLVFSLDILTKLTALEIMRNAKQPIEVLPFFNIVLGFNKGVAFGLFSSTNQHSPYILSGAAITVVAVLIIWLLRVHKFGEALAIGVIIGGASANIVDRLHDGAVTDFLDLHLYGYHWPAFNAADIGIVFGAAFLIYDSFNDRSDEISNGPTR